MSREGLIKASKSVVHYILCNDTLPLKIFALVPQFLITYRKRNYIKIVLVLILRLSNFAVFAIGELVLGEIS